MSIHRLLRRALAALTSALVLALPVATTAGGSPTKPAATATLPSGCGSATPKLSGTFLEPALFEGWTTAHWASEYAAMQAVCMHQVIVRYAADTGSNRAWYPTSLPDYQMTYDLLTPVFHDAPAGMAVYVGLQVNDGAWFNDHANDPAQLAAEEAKAAAIAADITAHYRGDPSFRSHFAGWYLPFEVDNANFAEAAAPLAPPPACPSSETSAPATPWENLAGCFFDPLTLKLRATLAGGQRIITAPMFYAGSPYTQTTTQWAQMWAYLLTYSSIDTLAPQDGVGAEHATTAQLAPWYEAAANGVAAANTHRRGVVQLWDDAESYLHNESMPIGTLVADLGAVRPYLSKSGGGTCGPAPTTPCGDSITFQFLHLSPIEAPLYYAAYQAYVRTGTLATTPPPAPLGVTAQPVDAQTVRLSWAAPTDPTIAGYDLYRWTGPGQPGPGTRVDTLFTPIPSANECGVGLCVTDSGLPSGTAITYALGAFNAIGLESTAPVTAITPTLTVGPDLALGRPHSATLAADPAYPDPGGTKLTDGVLGPSSDWWDPAWEGRHDPPDYSFVIDLGTVRSIAAVRSDWMQQPQASIVLPMWVTYSVSNDGATWTPIGTVFEPLVNELTPLSQGYQVLTPGSAGRFVKVDIVPNSTTWSFVDEVQVFAPAS